MDSQHALTRAKYRRLAPWYDTVAAPVLGVAYQREAVSLLKLRDGDVVVDAACGTGTNFALIEQGIGCRGHLIGLDLSPEMLQQARYRVVSHGWRNVTLINALAEEVRIDETVDAFLFSFAHDVLISSRALQNLFQHAGRGARVAACGIKLAPWWFMPLNFFVLQIAQQFHTMQTGLAEPWQVLASFASDLEIKQRAFETVFVASGTLTSSRLATMRTDH